MEMESTTRFACNPRPFLKWAGGKRALAGQILEIAGTAPNRYFEPFVGAGALLFSKIQAKEHIVGDLNSELIATYRIIQSNPTGVGEALVALQQSEEDFYRIRAWDRDPSFSTRHTREEIAARMIYLNRLCFNGLYRVNSKNEFNVPFGKRTFAADREVENIHQVSAFLAGKCEFSSTPVKIREGQYRLTSHDAAEGDLLYFDPPYSHTTAESFVNYQPEGFSPSNQVELRDWVLELKRRGARCLVSNSDTPQIRELYGAEQDFRIHEIVAPRRVGAGVVSRSAVTELLIETTS